MKHFHVVVQKGFMDRRTGIKRKPGEKLVVDEARLREIKRSGDYVAVDKAATEAAEKAATESKK